VLSSQRKQDIIAGITSSQESLFNTSFHFLQHLTSEMSTYTDENTLRAYVDPVSSLLGLLRVLAAVVKIDDFCSPSHNFALQLVGLLSMGIPSLQMKLLEVLQVMVQSTMGEELFVEVLSAFAHCSIGTAGLELEDELQLQCQLASVLHCLLSHHVSYVNSDDSVQRIDKYLSQRGGIISSSSLQSILQLSLHRLLTILQQTQSTRLVADVIKDWLKIFRDKHRSSASRLLLEDLSMPVLHCFMQKVRRPSWMDDLLQSSAAKKKAAEPKDDTERLERAVFEVEFEDPEEWSTEFYGRMKSQLKLLCQAMYEHYPVLSCRGLAQCLDDLLSRELQQQDNSSSEMVKLRAELEVFHYMYSPLLVLLQQASSSRSSSSSSTSSLPPSSSLLVIDDETLEHCSRYTEQCLMKILEWQPLSYALKQEQLRMLQYQCPVLKDRRQYLGPVMSYLFTALDHFSQSSDMTSKVSATIAILTKSCAVEIVQSGR